MLVDQQLPAAMTSKPARLIEKHRERRVKLRQDQRTAQLALTAAENEAKAALAAIEIAASEALAFDSKGPGPAHRKRLDAAEHTLREAQAGEQRIRGAIGLVDQEMIAIARDNYRALHKEITALHEQINDRIAAALAAAQADLNGMRETHIALQNVMHAAGQDTSSLTSPPKNIGVLLAHGLPWPLQKPEPEQPAGIPSDEPPTHVWRSRINEQ